MTEPTQAQIDAAAEAVCSLLEGRDAEWENYRTFAKAALTAAAEVGDLRPAMYPSTQTMIASTIERCARVADTWAEYHKESGLAKHVLVGCAAAIRALATEGHQP